MHAIDARTRAVAVLGYPIEHSLSPLIHNTAFRAQGLNYVYLAARVSPEEIGAAVAGLRALGLAGANVTIPHKQAVLRLMDELSPQAQAVGAVNTIVCRGGEAGGTATLYGDNTDVAGFLQPLMPLEERLRGTRMLLFGAGGAARAVAYGLLTAFRPERLWIDARTPEKALALIQQLSPYDESGALAPVPPGRSAGAVRESRLLVNTTPLGMHPREGETPLADASLFSSEHVVYDLVYNPEETRFLRDAAARGAFAIGGMEMLVGQAAAAYAQWTGRTMPVDVVRRALAERLKNAA